jgi:hypothetical protein
MVEKNYLINNPKASKLERLEVSSSVSLTQDPKIAVSGFSMAGISSGNLLVLDISNNELSSL